MFSWLKNFLLSNSVCNHTQVGGGGMGMLQSDLAIMQIEF